jgi:hypothetical protein
MIGGIVKKNLTGWLRHIFINSIIPLKPSKEPIAAVSVIIVVVLPLIA